MLPRYEIPLLKANFSKFFYFITFVNKKRQAGQGVRNVIGGSFRITPPLIVINTVLHLKHFLLIVTSISFINIDGLTVAKL